jgi:hypothetical protein
MNVLCKTATPAGNAFAACLVSLVIFFLSSCNSVTPLKGNYPDSYTYSTAASKDVTWDKLISFFTAKGITISTVDKPSGIITAVKYSFDSSYTAEDSLGKLVNPKAWMVINFKCPTLHNKPDIWGNINVQVTESTGITKVIVTINNIGTNASQYIDKPVSLHSTGVFEKTIGDLIKP